MEEYIEIPIVADFDYQTPIGTVKILRDRIPDNPDWLLSLGFKQINEYYEPVCFSIVMDENYKKYLNDID